MITDGVLGEIVCGSCGLVLVEKVEDSALESRIHDVEEYLDKSRTGSGSTLAMHDMGLTTVIGTENKDASGNFLSSDMKNRFKRLRLWNTRSESRPTDRNLKMAFTILNTIKTKLAIPDMVIEKAAYIYRKAIVKKLTRGRSISGLIHASLYAACRETDTPRTLRDIAHAGNLTKKNLATSYRNLIKILDLNLKPYDPSEFITRISSQVGISEKTRRDALNILSKAAEKEISVGKNPVSLAAASLYLSCMMNHEEKNQDDIAKASGVTAVTIRNRVRSLRKDLKIKIGS
ncbi:MAG TPA: transcription initiation factor IIB [Nitrosopumilaceae archaeon]|nr:transcription initiation factor IIB [Nitrosopumilaceae archaeon]